MADFQEGVQVLFDGIEASDNSSESTNSNTTGARIDYHQEQYPSYVPPHRRGHNTQQDKFVNIKPGKAGERDKVEGVDHESYQKLSIGVPFALKRNKLLKLKEDFPGVFFHCRDNGNHDHPFSHMVTVIGTRLMQRRIKPGMRVLDVYGNPNACDRFNTSQMNAAEPKFMKALVNRVGPTDFIREVNKWGPFFDAEEGIERYHRGSLMSMIRAGELEHYDVLTFTHTLYYTPMHELAQALHAPGNKRVAYALIHRHQLDKGSINDGEQTYTKKRVGVDLLVRQVNAHTNSSYVHPDLGFLFCENKTWLPEFSYGTREQGEVPVNSKGLAWETHIVNDDTWVVEFVPYIHSEVDGIKDYAAMWEDDDCMQMFDPMTTPSNVCSDVVHLRSSSAMIPTLDGKFIEVDIPCPELFNHLRMRCSGKDRTPKLLEELIATANHLVNPSTLFGDKPGMRCPPDKVYDVAVAAWCIDIGKETNITTALSAMRPVLNKHAKGLKLGPTFASLSMMDLMTGMRVALKGARAINHTVRSKDFVEVGLDHLEKAIT